MRARGATPGLVLAAILAAGATTAAGEPSVLVHAIWLDVEAAAVGIEGVTWAECDSVLQEAGLDVEWRRGSGGVETLPGEIRVILLGQYLVDPEEPRFILGATLPQVGEHPVVWIHLGSVLATLGVPPDFPTSALSPGARRDLGVALGRIVAHEIVHVLAPWLEHGDEVMAPLLRPEELTGSDLSLDPRVAEALRQALKGAPEPPRSQGGVQAASGRVEAGGGR